jgi:hypothetical protein
MAEEALALSVFTVVYGAVTMALGIGTARSLWQRFQRR